MTDLEREHACAAAPVPAGIRGELEGYEWGRDTVGMSGGAVYRLHGKVGAPDLFLKHGSGSVAEDVTDEMVRLLWLRGYLAVIAASKPQGWLLQEYGLQPALLAEGLKTSLREVSGMASSDKKPFFSCAGCFLAGGALTILAAILLPGWIHHPKSSGQLTACRANLQNLSTAAEMYASDNHGVYPDKLSQLVHPKYLAKIPTCPAAGEDTYSASYLCKGKDYSLYCRGTHHQQALPGPTTLNLPAYSSQSGLQPAVK